MVWPSTDGTGVASGGRKFAAIRTLQDLETGSYWPQLQPYFLWPEYRNIRYRILGSAAQMDAQDHIAMRGASKAGELEVAFVSDQLGARMSIAGNGLPDYCLTAIGQGHLTYSANGIAPQSVNRDTGLIYRGAPGTELASDGPQKRTAVWIPGASITERLSALLDAPVMNEVAFQPVFAWDSPHCAGLRQLFVLLEADLCAHEPNILGNQAANRSFADLLIYTLLRCLSHNYSTQLERSDRAASPRILRRAEDYIRAHVEDPIALHDIANAAGCSVRCLQMTFRNFRDTTPLLAIRQFRLEAARDVLSAGGDGITVTEIAHRFGFSNPGRFTRFYRDAFGVTPAEARSQRKG